MASRNIVFLFCLFTFDWMLIHLCAWLYFLLSLSQLYNQSNLYSVEGSAKDGKSYKKNLQFMSDKISKDSLRYKKRWDPPLLGELSPTFLRISLNETQRKLSCLDTNKTDAHHISSSFLQQVCLNCASFLFSLFHSRHSSLCFRKWRKTNAIVRSPHWTMIPNWRNFWRTSALLFSCKTKSLSVNCDWTVISWVLSSRTTTSHQGECDLR